MPMMAITTSSSINVNPVRRRMRALHWHGPRRHDIWSIDKMLWCRCRVVQRRVRGSLVFWQRGRLEWLREGHAQNGGARRMTKDPLEPRRCAELLAALAAPA